MSNKDNGASKASLSDPEEVEPQIWHLFRPEEEGTQRQKVHKGWTCSKCTGDHDVAICGLFWEVKLRVQNRDPVKDERNAEKPACYKCKKIGEHERAETHTAHACGYGAWYDHPSNPSLEELPEAYREPLQPFQHPWPVTERGRPSHPYIHYPAFFSQPFGYPKIVKGTTKPRLFHPDHQLSYTSQLKLAIEGAELPHHDRSKFSSATVSGQSKGHESKPQDLDDGYYGIKHKSELPSPQWKSDGSVWMSDEFWKTIQNIILEDDKRYILVLKPRWQQYKQAAGEGNDNASTRICAELRRMQEVIAGRMTKYINNWTKSMEDDELKQKKFKKRAQRWNVNEKEELFVKVQDLLHSGRRRTSGSVESSLSQADELRDSQRARVETDRAEDMKEDVEQWRSYLASMITDDTFPAYERVVEARLCTINDGLRRHLPQEKTSDLLEDINEMFKQIGKATSDLMEQWRKSAGKELDCVGEKGLRELRRERYQALFRYLCTKYNEQIYFDKRWRQVFTDVPAIREYWPWLLTGLAVRTMPTMPDQCFCNCLSSPELDHCAGHEGQDK